MNRGILLAAGLMGALPAMANAQSTPVPVDEASRLRADLNAAQQRIDALEARLEQIDRRSTSPARVTVAGNGGTQITPVGEAPEGSDRMPEIAALGEQGAAITRRGQLTIEPQLDYTRADRNRALFRGIELVQSVLVGVFDINESRQDVLSASIGARYGLLDRLELGVRVPFIYRSDTSILTPVAGSTGDDAAATIDNSVKGSGVGDIEATLRYQITRSRPSSPFLVGNLQVVAPTGTDPFKIARDETGRALKAATGSGFWGVTSSLTAILPTDPAVLFGSIGYTHNFGRDVNTAIPPVRILRVDPGDAIAASAGIGVALNQRTSFNIGYAHSWGFGSKTTTEPMELTEDSEQTTSRTRDLQIGRLLFGVTYRLSDASSLNWGVEVGATQDAPDVRTTLRVPMTVARGR